MKKLFIAAALVASASVSVSAGAQVSISVGQPGFYGRVDLGSFAPAPQVYGPPVLVARGGYYDAAPIYLRVPLDHRRHWSRYCGRYNACGQRVLFVRDDWYVNSYAPRYREHYGRGGPGWRGHGGPAFHDRGGPAFHDNRGHGGGHGGGPGRGPDRGPDRGDGHGRNDGGHHGGGPGRDHGGGNHDNGGRGGR